MDEEHVISPRTSVPIWHKPFLTVTEAAAYFNIGEHRLRELTDDERCPHVVFCGNKRLIKRESFQKYIEHQYSI